MKNDYECESEKLGETDPLMETKMTTYMSINDITKEESTSATS